MSTLLWLLTEAGLVLCWLVTPWAPAPWLALCWLMAPLAGWLALLLTRKRSQVRLTCPVTAEKEIYACEFFYNEEGLACWPKLDVNFTNKTQFVYRINKGVLDVSDDKTLNDSMPDDSKRIPFTNMIYVGDGLSDVPCMKMMRAYGGQAIAVYQEENRQGVEDLLSKGRVDFIFPADYREGTTLDSTVKNIIRKMAICDTLAEENAAQFRQIGRSPLPYQASLFEET